jgi:RNA polymerase sigma factor (sigma-70 family)
VQTVLDLQTRPDLELLAVYTATRSEIAFAEIVNRHGGSVLRICTRVLGDAHEAADAAQAVFLVLAERPDVVRHNLAAWLHQVALSAARDVRKARKRRQLREQFAVRQSAQPEAPAISDALPSEIRTELNAALEHLPLPLREAVVLTYLEGMNQEDAARVAGCSRRTIGWRSSKALERLRLTLEQRGMVVTPASVAALLTQEAVAPNFLSASLNTAATVQAGATAKSVINSMYWAKFKMWVACIVLVVATAAVPLVANYTSSFEDLEQPLGSAPAPQPAPLVSGRQSYYVSTVGSDEQSGSAASPFRTLCKGVAALRPGDSLLIAEGTYEEALINNLPGGHSWENAVTVAAIPGQRVVLKPKNGEFVLKLRGAGFQYLIFDGLIFDGSSVSNAAVYISYNEKGTPHHIRLQNCEICNSPRHGVMIEGNPGAWPDHNELLNVRIHDNGTTDMHHGIYIESSHNLVEGCEIYRNAGWGIHLYKDSREKEAASHNIIRGNRVHDNARAGQRGPGIGVYCGTNNVIVNNLVWKNALGISVSYGAAHSHIGNNTIYSNKDEGVWIAGEAEKTTVKNCIIYQNKIAIRDQGKDSMLERNLETDPAFVNETTFDFRLGAQSAAIDAGAADVQAPTAIDQVARPQGAACDLGAYER